MRALPARVGSAPFFDQCAKDLPEVQEPLLGPAKGVSQSRSPFGVSVLTYPYIREVT